jgi:hypothetical protein
MRTLKSPISLVRSLASFSQLLAWPAARLSSTDDLIHLKTKNAGGARKALPLFSDTVLRHPHLSMGRMDM